MGSGLPARDGCPPLTIGGSDSLYTRRQMAWQPDGQRDGNGAEPMQNQRFPYYNAFHSEIALLCNSATIEYVLLEKCKYYLSEM